MESRTMGSPSITRLEKKLAQMDLLLNDCGTRKEQKDLILFQAY